MPAAYFSFSTFFRVGNRDVFTTQICTLVALPIFDPRLKQSFSYRLTSIRFNP
jgi:hypothetical protein